MEATKQQKKLTDLIDERLSELDLPEEPSLLYDPVRYTLSASGKRIRPYLTLIGCGLCNGEVEEALPSAVAVELLHNFTLLHDDIMDAAQTRRGEPSVFNKWDANTAILAGDAMYAKAFKQLRYYGQNPNYSKEQYAEILDIFLESAETVCEGQAFDLDFEKRIDVSIDEYLNMIKGKTAALISGSLALGGAVAGGSPNKVDKLKAIGEKAGIAFQIQDDLLDVVADPDKFGKQKGGDIIEGKKTYLTLLSLQRCDGKQKQHLVDILQKDEVTDEDIDSVIEMYNELNIIEDSQSTIQYHYQTALDHLDAFEPSEYKKEFIEFLNRLISREY